MEKKNERERKQLLSNFQKRERCERVGIILKGWVEFFENWSSGSMWDRVRDRFDKGFQKVEFKELDF
jgi:hypothetical protein